MAYFGHGVKPWQFLGTSNLFLKETLWTHRSLEIVFKFYMCEWINSAFLYAYPCESSVLVSQQARFQYRAQVQLHYGINVKVFFLSVECCFTVGSILCAAKKCPLSLMSTKKEVWNQQADDNCAVSTGLLKSHEILLVSVSVTIRL